MILNTVLKTNSNLDIMKIRKHMSKIPTNTANAIKKHDYRIVSGKGRTDTTPLLRPEPDMKILEDGGSPLRRSTHPV
jgi:hypothetical protein